MSLLQKIIDVKQDEVALLKKKSSSLKENLPQKKHSLTFSQALQPKHGGHKTGLRIIAECKKASPSRGLLCEQYNPEKIASLYCSAGAAAISVLTDETFFQGKLTDLRLASKCGLPILRKDFIISPLQVYEAKHAGAAAILLIVRILSMQQLRELYEVAKKIELDVLVEVHNWAEAQMALDVNAQIIGINHRNLDTLSMDLSVTQNLAPELRKARPQSILVAESGVESRAAREKVEDHVDAILVGTALMTSSDPAALLGELSA